MDTLFSSQVSSAYFSDLLFHVLFEIFSHSRRYVVYIRSKSSQSVPFPFVPWSPIYAANLRYFASLSDIHTHPALKISFALHAYPADTYNLPACCDQSDLNTVSANFYSTYTDSN